MKTRIFSFLSLFILPLAVSAQQAVPAEADAFFQKAMTQINRKHVAWVKRTAIDVNSKNLDENAVNTLAKSYGQLSGMGDMDIMAMAFIVMMEAAKSAREDLKAIMDKVKVINEKKKTWREAMQLLNEQQANKQEISRYQYDSLKALKTDSLNLQKIDISKKINNRAKITAEEIDQLKNDLRDKLDSLSEMSEMTSLRLQMMMDRRSKMISTLSNVMKKISQTQDSIIQNLK